MKKIKLISLLLALVMVLGLFAACGSEKPADDTTGSNTTAGASNDTTVDNTQYTYGTVHGVKWTWGGTADKADATAVEREKERNAMYFIDTGNTRECVAFTYNYDTVGALFEGGQMPTSFSVAATEPRRLVDAGWGRPINDCIKAVGLDLNDFNQSILETYMDADGNIYGLPYTAYALSLVINGTMYKEAGLVDENGEPLAPKTWDEVIEQSNIIAEKTGKGGLALECADREGGWFFTNIAWCFGADLCVWNEETGKFESGINTPETIAALEWYKKACHSDGLVGTPSTDSRSAVMNMMKAGECAIIMGAGDWVTAMTGDTSDGMNPRDLYMVPIPAGPDGEQYCLTGGAGYWFSSSATDEQVIAVLEYLMNYGTWTQEWTEAAQTSDLTTWNDRVSHNKIELPWFPVYDSPFKDERESKMFEVLGEVYNFETQFASAYDFARQPGAMHPEEEYETQNLYQELTNIMQEVATNPDADCAALVAKADVNYTSLLETAQG